MADPNFISKAIQRAKQAGYLPASGQRDVDWDAVEDWAKRVQQPEFQWLPCGQQSGTGYIIIAKNKAICSGQHRILGGLMGGNPVPLSSIDHLTIDVPTQDWK